MMREAVATVSLVLAVASALGFHIGEGPIRVFLDSTAHRELQSGVEWAIDLVSQRGLQPVADLRPVVDAVPEQVSLPARFHRCGHHR